jgi:L-threonylcarbamoyladenylate synthase
MENKIIQVTDKLPKESLDKIVQILKEGGLIVYPTETAYGIGCDVFNEAAVKRIFVIKQRASNQPLPVIVKSLDMAKEIAELTPQIILLSNTFHPGPLVIATRKKEIISDIVNPKGIAFRISSNKIVQQIVSAFDQPIISTSANISGFDPPYSVEEILSTLDANLIDIVIDVGELPKQKPSTIIDFLAEPSPQIVREGVIKANLILEKIGINKKDWMKYTKEK